MQQPDSRSRASVDNDAEPIENSYIKQLSSGGYISFKTLLIALVAILCVSLVVMVCLFGALNQRNEEIAFTDDVNNTTAHKTDSVPSSRLPGVLTTETTEVSGTVSAIDVTYSSTATSSVVVPVTGEKPVFAGGPENPIPPIIAPEMLASYTDETVLLGNIISQYAVLVDLQNDTVIAHKNGDMRMYPASMTKVMTLIVAYENIEDMNKYVTITAQMTDPPFLAGASVAGFKVGERVRLIDVMYGIALPSGADATSAVAFEVAGGEEEFVKLMNEKALQLGLLNTHFVNASGLHHPDHYTTPREMERIFEYAMSIPLLEEIMSTYMYRTEPTAHHPRTASASEVMTDGNITDDRFGGLLLVSTMFSRMNGDESGVATVVAGKTGYTIEGEHCLASCAETPDGRRYILITGKATPIEHGKYGAVRDAINIYAQYIPKS